MRQRKGPPSLLLLRSRRRRCVLARWSHPPTLLGLSQGVAEMGLHLWGRHPRAAGERAPSGLLPRWSESRPRGATRHPRLGRKVFTLLPGVAMDPNLSATATVA